MENGCRNTERPITANQEKEARDGRWTLWRCGPRWMCAAEVWPDYSNLICSVVLPFYISLTSSWICLVFVTADALLSLLHCKISNALYLTWMGVSLRGNPPLVDPGLQQRDENTEKRSLLCDDAQDTGRCYHKPAYQNQNQNLDQTYSNPSSIFTHIQGIRITGYILVLKVHTQTSHTDEQR